MKIDFKSKLKWLKNLIEMVNSIKTIVSLIIMTTVSIMGGACTHIEEPSHYETRTAEEESNPNVGLTFNMESDSLEEETEEIWFGAKDWSEEDMGVDL